MQYRRLCEGLNDRGKLIPADADISKYVKLGNPFKDVYLSIYKYSDKHKEAFEKTGSVAGITDLTVDKLLFDFDDKEFPEKARQDAVALCHRLIEKGIDEEYINAYWSGGKGIHIEVNLAEDLTPEEFKAVTKNLTTGLETYDSVVSNPSRIVRVPGSIHKGTQLYKTRLDLTELDTLSIDEIKVKAKNFIPSIAPNQKIKLPAEIAKLKKFAEKPAEVKTIDAPDLTMEGKPKFLTNCRYALQKGFFGAGERNTALLVLAATYRNQGFDEEHTYRLLKAVAEKQSKRTGQAKFDNTEIWTTIIKVVYSDSWRGGQYTCREPGNWLFDYCQSLGGHKCKHDEQEEDFKPRKLSDIHASFKDYVVNIEKNTILTGIQSLDEKIFLSTGCNVGIIGAPGSGKTSIALDIVNNTSKAGVRSVLASLDMHSNRLFEKALYRVTGYDRETLYAMFRENREQEIMKKLEEEFGNVNFFHKSCPTVSDLREYIVACNEQDPTNKVKLVLLDYFERVTSDLSDDTAASKRVAGELQDLVNDLDICLVTLVQPNKMSLSGGPDSPIMSYTNIKGSSYVYQAFRIIFSLWRPFYNPKDFSNDKYMQMAILKNDLGELSELEFKWDGRRGKITEMEDEERIEFNQLLETKKMQKSDSGDNSW